MTARDDAVVATGGEAPVTRVFRPGDIVWAVGYTVDYDGEVIPPPADRDADEMDPDFVWVNVRRQGPMPFGADALARLDVPRAVAGILDLLARVGIKVARHELGIRPEVAALICDDDEPGEHEHHARALVLWFESLDDVMALAELENFGPFEFGCNWPSIYADLGLAASATRPATDDPVIIRAVHLADLPTLADLARRELAGEFGGDAKSIRDRWLARSVRQLGAAVFGIQATRALVLHHHLGPFGWLALALSGVGLAAFAYRLARHGRPVPRTHLDAIRRRSRRVVRGSGPR